MSSSTRQSISAILEFIQQIEQLKAVLRKTKPIGLDRLENSAEHSWHVCLSALMLKDVANETVDIFKVIKMLLIHDLGEIDAGDQLLYAQADQQTLQQQKQQEQAGVQRLLSHLPDVHIQQELLALWQEFEFEDSAEARFARAIDRVPPLLQNLATEGGAWQRHNVRSEQVFAMNKRINDGSKVLWQEIEQRLQQAVDVGWLTK